MALGVLNNIAAIYAQNNLNQTQSSLQNTLQQLSSGSRINSGADDAAGLAVANGLGANVAALNQSATNAQTGVGLLQTADGALSQVTNLLNRAVTLATQAANGTLNATQVNSANQEYTNIINEIGNIGSTTNFNGNGVFSSTSKTIFLSDGTSSGANSFSTTIGALTTASVGLSAPTSTGGVASAYGGSPTNTASTGSVNAKVDFGALGASSNTLGGTLNLTVGSGSAFSVTIAAGSTVAQAVTALNANTAFATTNGLTASKDSTTGALVITGATGAAGAASIVVNSNTLQQTTAVVTGSTPGAGVDFTSSSISSLTASSAATVLTSATTAIADVAFQRGIIGANINQLNAAANVASSEATNLTAAQNNITATNYGQATSDLAKYQVLSQTGISALAQANSVQQEVLKLLQ